MVKTVEELVIDMLNGNRKNSPIEKQDRACAAYKELLERYEVERTSQKKKQLFEKVIAAITNIKIITKAI